MSDREATWNPVSASGAMISLVLLLGSLFAAVFAGALLKERAGSVVATGTVRRVVDHQTVVARVAEPAGPRSREVRIDPRYDRRNHRWAAPAYGEGSPIEVRYWLHGEQRATDTKGEVPLPGAWVLAVPAAGFLLGLAGLRIFGPLGEV